METSPVRFCHRLKNAICTFACCLCIFLANQACAQNDIASAPIVFLASGYDFVVLDKKQTHTPIHDDDPNYKVVFEQQIPQISGPVTAQAIAFNKAMQIFIDKEWQENGAPKTYGQKTDPYDTTYILLAGKSTDASHENYQHMPSDLISIAFVYVWYEDESRPGETPFSFNWVIDKQRPLEPGDIFDTKRDWRHYLKKQFLIHGECSSTPPIDVLSYVSDPNHWLVYRQGLQIGYDLEYLGCPSGGVGATESFIPWTSLAPYLNKSGLIKP